MTDRIPIEFKPGVVRKGSAAQMAGNWYEANLVRWVEGVLRPVGGIERMALVDDVGAPFAGFASTVRATHVWVTHDGITRTAVLCEEHLYIVTQGGEVFDISPTPGIAAPDVFEDGGYGDDIYYGAGGGLADPGDLVDPDPQPPLYTDPTGYGTARPDRPAAIVLGHMWSLDNFGDLLLAMASSDRRLLVWDPATPATPAAEIVPTPADALAEPPVIGGGVAPQGRFFVVTPQRHVMVFQESVFNRFAWCSQEDIKDWNYTNPDNSAGFYDIEPSSPFVTAVPTRTGILAFTATRSYLITYAGAPYFYTYTMLGFYNAPISGNAISRTAAAATWYSSDGFWTFDGSSVAPLPCPLLDWVKQTADPIWSYRRMVAVYLGMQSEIWFFFPERGQTENSRYVCFNFDEKWWSMGRLSRTAGSPGSALSYPLMSNGSELFLHEKGDAFADAPELPYAETAAIQIAKGARKATVRQGIADTMAPANDVQFLVAGRRDRIADGSEIEDRELALAIRRAGGKVDFRVTGRDIVLRVQAARNGVPPWSFGQMLVKVFPRGGR